MVHLKDTISMNISKACLDLIKKWEGCKLEAYLDPVGIPTIGWGTIAYPDGQPVAMGDRISQEQADGFLQHECNSIVPRIGRLVTVGLTQNQFDSLVSFAYNEGGGAFAESTLLNKLNQGDYAGAAAEFPRWNKGEVNGKKVELPGLTNRRKDERALFESTAQGGKPVEIDTTPTPQQQVTWLEGYLDGGNTVIVGWKGSEVVEILTLASKAKGLLIDVLNQYPKAANFVIAPAGKAIPAGDRVGISDRKGRGSEGVTPASAPPAPSQVLARGSKGEDVKVLQERLKDLGYYKKVIDSDFGSGTDAAVRAFQADVFGSGEADGKVGSKTWAKLWESAPPVTVNPTPGEPGKTYLRLTKTNRRDNEGLCVLLLDYIKNGVVQESLETCSGQSYAQNFRTGVQSRSGSMEPLPEGRWSIKDIAWANGKDVYGPEVFSSGLGPVSTPLEYVGPESTERGNIEIHIDWNGNGTAGCIGIRDVKDYTTLVRWLRDTNPGNLYVDWGKGTCPKP
jgi:lysozyme